LPLNDLVFQVFQVGVVQVELPLEGAIGHASTASQHVEGLIQDLLKSHTCFSIP
jgi:hypothetical protein